MNTKKPILLSLLTAALLSTQTMQASDDSNLAESKNWMILPYAFTSDSTGLAGGIGVIKQGLFQPQTTLLAFLFKGAEEDIATNGQEDTSSFSGDFSLFLTINYLLPIDYFSHSLV